MDTDSKVMDFMQSFLDAPEPEIDKEYIEVEKRYMDLFKHSVPREMLPDSVSSDEIKNAMKKCIENQKDNLMEILNVEISDKFVY